MGKLKALSKNEELGDIPTHFMKSGSSMPPQDRLNTLLEFQRRVLPKKYKGLDVEYLTAALGLQVPFPAAPHTAFFWLKIFRFTSSEKLRYI